MGQTSSKSSAIASKQQQQLSASNRSPSAAFGRLRIDSPAAHSAASRRRALQKHYNHEQSPLLMVQSSSSLRQLKTTLHQHQRHSNNLADTGKALPSPNDAASLLHSESSPQLVVWIGPALVCALMYALYNICIKQGSNSIHPVLGGVILQFVAAILGSLLLGVIIYQNSNGFQELECDVTGVAWAVGAGAAVGAAEILSFIVSGMGVQATQSIPVIIGGSVLFGTTLGYTVLKESLSGTGWAGVFLIAVGITLVGIDPGGAGSVY
ncbi:hypothetical protein MPSEU_000754400 [Mayamaea pseudoterrestris]|nr:hypothetical protein MPSEU_000754400 [Mayamaea pseudoterrestris]